MADMADAVYVAPDPLIVRTKRRTVNLIWGFAIGLHGLLMVGILALWMWLPTTDAPFAHLPFAILLAGECFQIGCAAYQWGARVAVHTPLVLSTQGVTMHTRHGEVSVPWEAITDVLRMRFVGVRALRFVLHPDVAPGAPGVVGPQARSFWRRARRTGLRVGGWGLSPGLDEIAWAVETQSAGRLRVG